MSGYRSHSSCMLKILCWLVAISLIKSYSLYRDWISNLWQLIYARWPSLILIHIISMGSFIHCAIQWFSMFCTHICNVYGVKYIYLNIYKQMRTKFYVKVVWECWNCKLLRTEFPSIVYRHCLHIFLSTSCKVIQISRFTTWSFCFLFL